MLIKRFLAQVLHGRDEWKEIQSLVLVLLSWPANGAVYQIMNSILFGY